MAAAAAAAAAGAAANAAGALLFDTNAQDKHIETSRA